MESLKIAVACFVGAALGVVVSYLVHPTLWWTGLAAGALAGYIAYDARAFFAAIPKALVRAARWFVKQTPEAIDAFQTPGGRVAIFYIGTWLVGLNVLYRTLPIREGAFQAKDYVVVLPVFAFIFTYIVTLGSLYAGMLIWKEYSPDIRGQDDQPIAQFDGHRKRRATYTGLFKWSLTGYLAGPFIALFMILYACAWLAWQAFKLLVWLFVSMIGFIGVFCRELFLIVHSDKRLLCGTCAVMGVLAGYLFGGRTASGMAEIAFAALVGGIFGAGLGLLSFRFLSRGLLKQALEKRA